MSVLGSFVAFGAVFVAVAVSASIVSCGVLALVTSALARRGPAAERRAVELAASIPVVLAITVVGVLVVHSMLATDHCLDHEHHAHLCIAHGGAWMDRPWAMALGAAASVVAVGRMLVLAGSLFAGRRRVRALRCTASIVADVRLVESSRAFCFVAGLWRPVIYASTAAWRGLSDDEREAMLSHERAHVRGHDVARRALLELATIVSAPLAPTFLAERWEAANERRRDRDAARATSPDAVARALVQMCRLGAVRVAGAAFESPESLLTRRVEAVLDDRPSGEPSARRITTMIGAAVASVAVAVVALADPLHHALETLLG